VRRPGCPGRRDHDQQLQFLQLQGLQRQPPLVQLQVQAGAVFSIVFSISLLLFARR
jgi:hypothetical protein